MALQRKDASMSRLADDILEELFSDNITAKVLRTATRGLAGNNPPQQYPEHVLKNGDRATRYTFREAAFWTCGFFPGCIYSLLERAIKYPGRFPGLGLSQKSQLVDQLRDLGDAWSGPLHAMAHRTDTHDMGFMILPAMRPRWELFQDERALRAIVTATDSLYSRYNATVGAIRSWDRLRMHDVEIVDTKTNFLVIIDSMCNLDLLYYAAAQTGRRELADCATQHARKVISTLLRVGQPRKADGAYPGRMYSTIHVVNFSPASGEMKDCYSAQGYAASSTWARGQAWAIMGFTQTYLWTGEEEFLDKACGLAEEFLQFLQLSPAAVEIPVPGKDEVAGRYVPLWDFNTPIQEKTDAGPLRDSSAGIIAANGMLMLSQALSGLSSNDLSGRFRQAALVIAKDTLEVCLAREKAILVHDHRWEVEDAGEAHFESILKHATANYNQKAYKRYWDHGLVYADYYLIEFGNRLLRMGLALEARPFLRTG